MNQEFRLALLPDWKTNGTVSVIDFTRYSLKAMEPEDPKPGEEVRNWSLFGDINQKQTRPQDKPIPIDNFSDEAKSLIRSYYPELIK